MTQQPKQYFQDSDNVVVVRSFKEEATKHLVTVWESELAADGSKFGFTCEVCGHEDEAFRDATLAEEEAETWHWAQLDEDNDWFDDGREEF